MFCLFCFSKDIINKLLIIVINAIMVKRKQKERKKRRTLSKWYHLHGIYYERNINVQYSKRMSLISKVFMPFSVYVVLYSILFLPLYHLFLNSILMAHGSLKLRLRLTNSSSLQGIVMPPIGWSYPNSSSAWLNKSWNKGWFK